jgi:hypothetical protein
MLFVMFFGPFRYFYFRVRVRLLGHLLPTLAWGNVQHIYHEISPISFRKLNFAANGQNFLPAPDGVRSQFAGTRLLSTLRMRTHVQPP